MNNIKKALFLGVIFAFLVMGFLAMKRAMPQAKEEHIYNALKTYMPYRLEKKIGGLVIVDIRTGNKELPSASEVMLRLDELEQQWGKTHLSIVEPYLDVRNDANQSIAHIFIENQKERLFLEKFFGL